MATPNDDVICETQTPSGAGAMTLVTSTGVILDVPRHIIITTGADERALTFTIVGTNRYGDAISESVAGPNATVGSGTKNFKSIVSVTISAAASGTIIVGTNDALEGPWIPLNRGSKQYAYSTDMSLTGNFTYAVQKTLDNVLAVGFLEDSAHVIADSGDHTDDQYHEGLNVPSAMRVKITSWVAGSLDWTIQTTH